MLPRHLPSATIWLYEYDAASFSRLFAVQAEMDQGSYEKQLSTSVEENIDNEVRTYGKLIGKKKSKG